MAITGTSSADTLAGTTGADTMFGLAGDDTLFGSALGDSLDGGADTDTVDYTASASAVLANLTTGNGFGGDAQGDKYASVENLLGSALSDTLTGGAGANLLSGGDGNDSLTGAAGADTLLGGSGTDTASWLGSLTGVAVDLLAGTASGGDAQGDSLDSIENLAGSALADILTGAADANILWGNGGNDSLDGGDGADTVFGGDGDDWVKGSLGSDNLDGGIGINTLDYTASVTAVTVNLFAGLTSGGLGTDSVAGFQNVIGSDFADVLTGDGADNILMGSGGADTLNGGGGIDTADYTSAGGAVIVNMVLGNGRGSVAQGDQLISIENLTGSAFNDSLTGDANDNVLNGQGGNDSLLGGIGNDTLIGGTGDKDSLTGGSGDDVYFVDAPGDRISELNNGGTDSVFSTSTFTLGLEVENLTLLGAIDASGTGNGDANILTGSTGSNGLYGGSGNDLIYGDDGDDLLRGDNGIDTMFGGNGDDSYFIDNPLDVADEAGTTGTEWVFSTTSWTLGTNFENLTLIGSTGAAAIGNELDNSLFGNGSSNLIRGFGGNDIIVGDHGVDSLTGGNDTLEGGSGSNMLYGGLGNDTYVVTTGTDLIVEGEGGGTDLVQSAQSIILTDNVENLTLTGLGNLGGFGNALDNLMTGNDGNNDLQGGFGVDSLFGGIGNDSLDGGLGVDALSGGIGDDTYIVTEFNEKVLEGADAGTDSVLTTTSFTLGSNVERLISTSVDGLALTGNTLDNVVTGNTGSDTIYGGSGADTLNGGGDADLLDGGGGSDTMLGGTGDDIYTVDEALDLTVEFFGEGTDRVVSSINWVLQANTDDLVLTGTTGLSGIGNGLGNSLSGNSGANLLNGLGGNDDLTGGDGADTLNGGDGNDTMIGGTGSDTYFLSSTLDVIVENPGEGTDLVKVGFTYTLLTDFENLTLTGTDAINGTGNTSDNTLTGATGDNLLRGLGGNDVLVGDAGKDSLDGGTGADMMSGGIGADTYTVDDLGDSVVETSARQIDLVLSYVTFTLGANVENLTLIGGILDGTGNGIVNVLTGTDGANLLTGLGGNDTLTGNGGDDTLDGGTGNDNMTGGNGNDTYTVNALADAVSEEATDGTDLVISSVNFTLGANLENLTLTGPNRVNATGNSDANIIIGNGAANKITGMAGDDLLTGGAGADQFIFTQTGDGMDTITDFNSLNTGINQGDRLQFAATLLVGGFAYLGAGDFTGGSNNSEARIQEGGVLLDFDGNGTGDLTILLTGLTTADQLSLTDFAFI